MSQQSLKDKTIKGTVWSAADAFRGQELLIKAMQKVKEQ